MDQPLHRPATEETHLEQLKKLDVVLKENSDVCLLVGDSILAHLENYPLPSNCGVLAKGGDKIGHLMWRLNHTPSSDQVVKIILHIGTNNLSKKMNVEKLENLSTSVTKVVEKLGSKFPRATLYVLPYFPREDVPVDYVNTINNKLAGTSEFLIDFWDFLPSTYDKNFYFDHVHLNDASNSLFHEKIIALLKK